MNVELTVENLRRIKLWHQQLFKDKEQEENDIEVLTKISAIIISRRDSELEWKRWFRKYGRVL